MSARFNSDLAKRFTDRQAAIAAEVGTFKHLAERFELGVYSEEGFMLTLMMILTEEE